uniref:VWFC domain-containing protein n=1 Tax=Branchiostoma floridae TaxID=7739 RepID=C3XZM3_BRAFL|eukprot:XP_002610534.1 hypothetical protein BRAFLDRAFT_65701 [Branchiostoma floridae]
MIPFFAILLAVLCSQCWAAPSPESPPTENSLSFTFPPDWVDELFGLEVFGTEPSVPEVTTPEPEIFVEYEGSAELEGSADMEGSGSGFQPIPRVPCPEWRDKEGDTWVEFEKCRMCSCSYGEAVCTRCVPAAEDRDTFFYKELVSRHCYLETVPEVVDHAPDACCAERQVCQYISPEYLDYSYHEYGRRVNYMLIYYHGDYDLADLFY